MFLLAAVLLMGLASTQKVTRLTFCSVDDRHLRMDCKYEPAADSPEATCKYTQGDRTLDATDPGEPQDPAYKNRAKVRIIDGNYCQLRFDNLPEGKNNFTCTVKQTETAAMTAVLDKRLLLPCSAWSVSLQRGTTGTLLAVCCLPGLLHIAGL
ncbi:hypothetical protein NHX12_009968 [Muraenolepis orangiensis]|uniref:Uncharacterized protein n=1 Tax=Muraenolepis orangiensis TaxID=630683 RepID=A0A9Q0I8F5_9TELE|nr:hypothetical protein NHX12_009968 [Muraenolepis orangiensis]